VKLFLLISILLLANIAVAQDSINAIDENGKKIGHWQFLAHQRNVIGYDSLEVYEEGHYVNNRKIGTWCKYYHGGQTKSEISFKNGRVFGNFITYDTKGNIKEEGIMKGYTATAPCIYPGGFKTADSFHKGGLASYDYDSKGNTLDSINVSLAVHRDTSLTGKDYVLTKDNYALAIGTNDTIKDGNHLLYLSSGDVLLKATFKNGKLKDGNLYIYDEDELLAFVEVYKDFKYVSRGSFFD
jgi:antitoxin component YwqK of YwqJK toxin-antitoxin module